VQTKPFTALAALAVAAACTGARTDAPDGGPPPIPVAVTNHAVAAGVVGGRWQLFAMLGVDSTKRWSGITRRAWAWADGEARWRALPDVPGGAGRLAATAQVVRGRVYLFGGYTVDSAGQERSVGAVDIWDPDAQAWRAGRPIPVPVDDAVSGVYRDSLIYLVSGWHDTDNVRDVQVYDVAADRWRAGTPIPGPGVFGHGGGMAEGTLVFIDGARRNADGPRYVNEPQAWMGVVDPLDPASITWTRLPDHPPPVRYRPAAAACGRFVVFAGGTDNPYNYDGIGYDRVPSEPLAGAMAYDTRQRVWLLLPSAPAATMDHRGLVIRGDTGWIAGGMGEGRVASRTVVRWRLGVCPLN
jgi:N-acetylneuraminic acid mutarotase